MTAATTLKRPFLFLLVLACALLAVATKAAPSQSAASSSGGGVWKLLDLARGRGPAAGAVEKGAAMGVGGRSCARFVQSKAIETDLADVIGGFYNNDVSGVFA